MGDRCVIYIDDAECAAYVHWDGHRALDLLKEAIPYMRQGDPDYSTARLIGYLHQQIPGNTGLGVWRKPEDPSHPVPDDCDGDAGMVIYNCVTGVARCRFGYLAEQNPGELRLPMPSKDFATALPPGLAKPETEDPPKSTKPKPKAKTSKTKRKVQGA